MTLLIVSVTLEPLHTASQDIQTAFSHDAAHPVPAELLHLPFLYRLSLKHSKTIKTLKVRRTRYMHHNIESLTAFQTFGPNDYVYIIQLPTSETAGKRITNEL